jgi:GTPase SAR1 family protein
VPEGDNIWEWFGFKGNPFDFFPLRVNADDRSLFVGREAELKRLATPIASGPGGITVVEGRAGVGKTSLVNAVQYDKLQSRVCLPSFQVIQVLTDTDPIGFMLSAFSTCINSLELADPGEVDKIPALKAGKTMVAQAISTGWGFTGGLTVGPFGGQAGVTKTPAPTSPLLPLMPSILGTAEKWFDAASKRGWSKFIIPVNNLDMLDDDSAASFMNAVRDYLIAFARKGVWWVLVAKEAFTPSLEARAHRVSDVLSGPPVRLSPLSLQDVKKAIDVRVKKYAVSDAKSPVPDEIVAWLYKLSDGEARTIFKKLTDTIFELHALAPSARTVSETTAKQILIGEARRKVQSLEVKPNWLKILQRAAKEGQVHQGAYGDHGFNNQPTFRNALEKLCTMDLLRRKEVGREVVYFPTADTNLVFQEVNTNPA